MRSVELFSGAGGLALGTAEAGFKHELVAEWNDSAFATLTENKRVGLRHLRSWPIEKADVRELDFSRFGQGIDLVAGGPPCQPFSIGGKHRGPTDSRDMWPAAIRAVRELAPRAFLFENVRGLLRPAFADYLAYVKLRLEWPELTPRAGEDWTSHLARLMKHAALVAGGRDGLRYRVTLHRVNAADYGAAQKRHRVILVGLREDQYLDWTFPRPTHSREALVWSQWVAGDYWLRHGITLKRKPSPSLQDRRLALRLEASARQPDGKPWVTVRDAIAGLPKPYPMGKDGPIPNHGFQPGARPYVGHTGSPLDEPAKALKAGAHGVPGGENMLVEPYGSIRYFTIREAARLQGFPDEYVFPVVWSESMRQLGNAVPVSLAKAIADSLAQALRGKENKHRAARAA